MDTSRIFESSEGETVMDRDNGLFALFFDDPGEHFHWLIGKVRAEKEAACLVQFLKVSSAGISVLGV